MDSSAGTLKRRAAVQSLLTYSLRLLANCVKQSFCLKSQAGCILGVPPAIQGVSKVIPCIFSDILTLICHTLIIKQAQMQPNIRCLLKHSLAFAFVSPDLTTSKLCEDTTFGNSVWHCVYKIYGFISVEKLATFSYVVGIFFPLRNFQLISEKFKLFR